MGTPRGLQRRARAQALTAAGDLQFLEISSPVKISVQNQHLI